MSDPKFPPDTKTPIELPAWVLDSDDYDDPDPDELFDCHMGPDGHCSAAGSEDCEWDCPYNANSAVSRARRKRERKATP